MWLAGCVQYNDMPVEKGLIILTTIRVMKDCRITSSFWMMILIITYGVLDDEQGRGGFYTALSDCSVSCQPAW
jgi:hypothetical protein